MARPDDQVGDAFDRAGFRYHQHGRHIGDQGQRFKFFGRVKTGGSFVKAWVDGDDGVGREKQGFAIRRAAGNRLRALIAGCAGFVLDLDLALDGTLEGVRQHARQVVRRAAYRERDDQALNGGARNDGWGRFAFFLRQLGLGLVWRLGLGLVLRLWLGLVQLQQPFSLGAGLGQLR